jgi:hypothetical protein
MTAEKSTKFVLTVCLLLVITTQALGMCATCTWSADLGTWRCSSQYPGNPFTDGWTNCEATQNSGCIMGGEYCPALMNQLKRKVIIDEKMILDVANQQPRLALALLTFRQYQPSYNKTRIFSPAIKVSTSDVRRALAHPNAVGARRNRSAEKPTVYDVSWRDGLDSRNATLVLSVVSPSIEGLQPPHFEVEFVKTDIRGPAVPTFKATNWRIVRGPASYEQSADFFRSFEIGNQLTLPLWVFN